MAFSKLELAVLRCEICMFALRSGIDRRVERIGLVSISMSNDVCFVFVLRPGWWPAYIVVCKLVLGTKWAHDEHSKSVWNALKTEQKRQPYLLLGEGFYWLLRLCMCVWMCVYVWSFDSVVYIAWQNQKLQFTTKREMKKGIRSTRRRMLHTSIK